MIPRSNKTDVEMVRSEYNREIRLAAHDINTAVSLVWHHIREIRKHSASTDPSVAEELAGIEAEMDVVVQKVKTLAGFEATSVA